MCVHVSGERTLDYLCDSANNVLQTTGGHAIVVVDFIVVVSASLTALQ